MKINGFVAYVKQLWKNKPDTSTPLSAERLLHIEDGIKGNSDAIEKIAAAVVSQIVNDPEKIASMASVYAVDQKVAKLNSDFSTPKAENGIDIDKFGQVNIYKVYSDVTLNGLTVIGNIPALYRPKRKKMLLGRVSSGTAMGSAITSYVDVNGDISIYAGIETGKCSILVAGSYSVN